MRVKQRSKHHASSHPSTQIHTRHVQLSDLHQDPANARRHPEENLAAIVASLRRFGQAEPLVVQKGTGRIIGGNGRYAAMQQLGWDSCDVVELEVDDLTATSLGIALNRTAEKAEWDNQTLARLLQELKEEDALDGVGFDDVDLGKLLDDLGSGNDDEDEAPTPEPMDNPITKPGDLWILGDHRLLCGDSSSPADVDILLGGERIHLVNTDPPYNVKVEPRSNNAIATGLSSFTTPGKTRKTATHHQGLDPARHPEKARPTGKKLRAKDRPLVNDFVSDNEFDRLLLAWFGNAARVLMPGRGFYIWGGYHNCVNYPSALKAHGLYFSQAIIWVKEHPVLTRKDFMGNHEWCFYGWKEGAAHRFFGPANATDTWVVKKINPQSMVHLTEKPVELAVRAIKYSSRRGENVLDLFGGSGSTLMGCEQTARRGFLMEMDPAYCDVIVKRWQNATDRDAILSGTSKTFAAVEKERSA